MARMPTMAIDIGNRTVICQETERIMRANIWNNGNPLKAPFSLFMLQVSMISLVSLLFDLLLKPFGQLSIVSQIFGGILFGPSMLGQNKKFADILFPIGGTDLLETTAVFGLMFFLFIIGVKMDPALMLRPGRKAMAIGFSLFFFSTTLPTGLSFILAKSLPVETSLGNSLIYLAALQSLIGFPVIASLLTELKILNTDIGRLALSSAMFCDIFGVSLNAIGFAILLIKEHNAVKSVWAILSLLALVAAILFIFRPMISWILNRLPEGKPVDENYIFSIMVFVLMTGLMSEVVGQHYVFGPLLLGFVAPEGPPLGVALESKLDTLVSTLFYPIYLATSGLQTNVFKIHFQSLWIVGIIVVFAVIVKILAVMVPAIYSNTPTQEAFVLGLILNAKGIIDVIVFSLWKENKVLTEEGFALSTLSVLFVTGIITPLIKLLYDPSGQYFSSNRSTIQHSKRDSELRILACIHNEDSIPTVINLLEVSHASENSPVAVIAMVLVELVGRTNPLLVSNDGITDTNTSRGRIVNALRLYEDHNKGNANVLSFTSISHFETTHDDICQMACDKRATVIVMPFHKRWTIDGSVGSMNRAIQTLNINVLEKAPCSVGILVDRGILGGSFSVLTNQSLFQVATLFIGGQDDVESLSYASRMGRHENVRVTVIRFLQFGAQNTKDRRHDSELINEYRRANMGNKNFKYLEEVVKDGEGLAASLRELVDCFDLILVGRYHQESPILAGLEAWSECPELGVIGDMLASPDFESTASVLVVMQQRIRGKMMHRNVQPMLTDREPLIHDVPSHEAPRSLENNRLSISVDRT